MNNNQKSAADHFIERLLSMDFDGEAVQYIIEGIHMKEQILRQLVLQANTEDIDLLLAEKRDLYNLRTCSHCETESNTIYVFDQGEHYACSDECRDQISKEHYNSTWEELCIEHIDGEEVCSHDFYYTEINE